MSPTTYVRLVIGGNINSVQNWSVGLSCAIDANIVASDLVAWLPTLDSPIATWWNATNGAGTFNSTDVHATGTAAYFYATAGSPAICSANHLFSTVLNGSQASSGPPQPCIVVSLKTDFTGRRNQGRMYVPLTTSASIAAHRIGGSQCAGLATATAALLHSINTSSLQGIAPGVVVAGPGEASYNFVTSVVVDEVPDTQRRRGQGFARTKHSVVVT